MNWTGRDNNPVYGAAAVILAGGKSTRMGCDKRFLPFSGKPLVQHIYEQVSSRFAQTMIATATPETLDCCNAVMVIDETPGLGPLGGIASALAATQYDLCFVLPCDMPRIDFALMTRLLQAAPGADCALPIWESGMYEPLFGAYGKSSLPHIKKAITAGERKVMRALTLCSIATVLVQTTRLDNMNTPEDYRRCCEH